MARVSIYTYNRKHTPTKGNDYVRIIAKKSDGVYHPNLTETVGIEIPSIEKDSIVESIEPLFPFVVELVNENRKELIKSLILKGDTQSIECDDITLGKVIAFMSESASGGRWTTEYLGQWFDDYISGYVLECVALARKYDLQTLTEEQRISCAVNVENMKKEMVKFASGKYVPGSKFIAAFKKLHAYIGDATDNVLNTINARVLKAEAETSEDALGF